MTQFSDMPARLAACRRFGKIADFTLPEFSARVEAEAFQAAAIQALGRNPVGFKIGATSVGVQQALQCTSPLYAPIFREDFLVDGGSFKIPAGLLGIESEFGFVMGRPFPAQGESLSLENLRSAVRHCFAALEIVGRRTGPEKPLNERIAIADFGLNVASVSGAKMPDWAARDLASIPVTAILDGVEQVTGSGALVMGNPLNALLWLAQILADAGQALRAGDTVLTGTATGVTPVSPGNKFEARFADLPPVSVHLA